MSKLRQLINYFGLEQPKQEETNQKKIPVLETIKPITSIEDAIISLHALSGVSIPQILKIKGYVKYHQLVVLIDSERTRNFINWSKAQSLRIFIHLINNFQVLIANEGIIKCGGHYENVKLQMGDYHLKSHMFSIEMGGCDIVLGAEWIRTLGPITMDFQELYMIFFKDSHTYMLQGIKTNPLYINSSYCMDNLLKKGHSGIFSQLHSLELCEALTLDPPSEMPQVLDTYSSVFDLPTGLPPSHGEHDHNIPLISGIQPPNVCPYRYPFDQNNEIEKNIQELLVAGVIRPSTIPYS